MFCLLLRPRFAHSSILVVVFIFHLYDEWIRALRTVSLNLSVSDYLGCVILEVHAEPTRLERNRGPALLLNNLRDLPGVQVDVVTEQRLKPRIRDRVLKEPELV